MGTEAEQGIDSSQTIAEMGLAATRNGLALHRGVPGTAPESESGRPPSSSLRPVVRGKFLFLNGQKLYVKGVTYGTFRPREGGVQYPSPEVVERDFTLMAAVGVNSVRTYTEPPIWLLDIAHRHGLFVLVGLAWEQHVAFLDDSGRARELERRTRHAVRSCAGHPAILAYAVGNEIPAPVVRWHGPTRVEDHLKRLYEAAKEEDPDGLVTYVTYPPTEYLQLPFFDFLSFNVYLETRASLSSYLARLHNIAGDKPLVLAELGLDSRSHGALQQANSLSWQIPTAFRSGGAGVFVFAWTDEWYVSYLSENGNGNGGSEIEDWDFGLTSRRRVPKPALASVSHAFSEAPFPRADWPRFSVVVCTHNGARTLRDCLEGANALDYPDFEVIVVDDGSTDESAALAAEQGCRLISTANRGLSSARNTGLKAATGELVAYLDDDARPDPHWLKYLADTFRTSSHVAVGGPNLAPPGDGAVADCVAKAPGGPTHVLLSDSDAEHIPGCNSAFRKDALEAIGGFDPRFRVAGDDVDVCWRLRDRGWTVGFSPSAVVWHHCRSTIRGYWRQQKGYGKAEALLERKWPERYNAGGHHGWAGRLYGGQSGRASGRRRRRIFHGSWGSALFQSVYERSPSLMGSLPSMPEWYLVIGVLGGISALGAFWSPLLVAVPMLAAAIAVLLTCAVGGAAGARFSGARRSKPAALRLHGLTALLFLLQPLARLQGRVHGGLTPWRRRCTYGSLIPLRRMRVRWSESPLSAERRLEAIETSLCGAGVAVARGGDFDDWDLEVRDGGVGAARLRILVEEHGAGRQFVRFKIHPRVPLIPGFAAALLSVLATGAALDGAWPVAVLFAAATTGLVLRAGWGCGAALAALVSSVELPQAAPAPLPATRLAAEESAA